eukprot:TRINITY_DN15437_c0_g1_i1.p1 TRINITY_DN15437_c0_g1~~TRINITY_DN15437_c0_g1_i1.p1  ORF type:complete len:440 (-),score=76.20 TRINITY_DN15437_c0_g1_i1:23-1342(-)
MLHLLNSDTFVVVCSQSVLSIYDIMRISFVSKVCNNFVLNNISLWQYLCKEHYGVELKTKDDIQQHTTGIGLAQQQLTWKDFYVLVTLSDVFTWGKGSGRTGHLESITRSPKILDSLNRKGIQVLGKTAEIGSVALSRNGQTLYFWGSIALSQTPVCVPFSSFSKIPHDRVIHCSCGHDSKYLLTTEAGCVYLSNNGVSPNNWKELTSTLLKEHLQPGEKPFCTVGGQSDIGGVVTTHSRVIWWRTYQMRVGGVIDAIDPDNKPFTIVNARFGHREMHAIDSIGRLFNLRYEHFETKRWNLLYSESRVIDVDGGSHHAAFATENGQVYTYGKGHRGMLGHGDTQTVPTPKRVEWFHTRNMKVVAVGCGGHIYGEGSFTIYLLSDNRLFYTGMLGSEESMFEPTHIKTPELEGRHILSISAGEDWAGMVVSGIDLPEGNK